MTNIALFVCRLTLGMLFVFAGIRKLIPAPGMTFRTNLEAFVNGAVVPNAPLPEAISRIYGYSLPFVELLAGALLVVGLLTRLSATLILLMLVSFVLAMGLNWWPARGPAFSENVVLACLAFLPRQRRPGPVQHGCGHPEQTRREGGAGEVIKLWSGRVIFSGTGRERFGPLPSTSPAIQGRPSV